MLYSTSTHPKQQRTKHKQLQGKILPDIKHVQNCVKSFNKKSKFPEVEEGYLGHSVIISK